jgi:hypothetical protein
MVGCIASFGWRGWWGLWDEDGHTLLLLLLLSSYFSFFPFFSSPSTSPSTLKSHTSLPSYQYTSINQCDRLLKCDHYHQTVFQSSLLVRLLHAPFPFFTLSFFNTPLQYTSSIMLTFHSGCTILTTPATPPAVPTTPLL